MNDGCVTSVGGARDELVSDHFRFVSVGDTYELAV
jgi:hypothetical protein